MRNSIKRFSEESLKEIKIHPEAAKTALKTFIRNRPHWCISRQRSWGVPIPVFYSKESSKPFTSSFIIEHLCKLIKENNEDIWWSSSIDVLLPKSVLEQSGFPTNEEYSRGTDIFDIWFDSGLSWKAVLPDEGVADLCVEGKDQSRGWFQSLLLTSIALRNRAPYKSLLVHGFVMDEKRQKMSKSIGNVVEPKTLISGSKGQPGVGVDAVRWWVAQHDSFASDYCLSQKAIEKSAADIVKIRNFLKFILGCLFEFDYEKQHCDPQEMLLNDKYMIHNLQEFSKKTFHEYNEMKYSTFVRLHLDDFLSRLTSFYFEAIKDRLYCDDKLSLSRRSCQTTLYHILEILVRSLAPLVPHLAEEAFLHHPDHDKRCHGVFRTVWKDTLKIGQLLTETELLSFEIVDQLHSAVSKSSEVLNTSFSNVDLIVKGTSGFLRWLKILQEEDSSSYSELCIILRVASVTLLLEEDVQENMPYIHRVPLKISFQNEDHQVELLFMKACSEACERCRRCTAVANGQLCSRCSTVLANIQNI